MNLAPLVKMAFLDNNGNPLNGGLLFTYIVGTSTKIATYTDASGITPNTNPIVLDFRGEANVWLDPALTYKFTLAPPGDTDPPTKPIWTVDHITSAISFADLTQQIIGQILYPRTVAEIAAGVAPTNYAIPSHLAVDVILPQRYGLVASGLDADATTNSTAIQAASEVAFSLGGGRIVLPANSASTYIAINLPPRIFESVSISGAGQRFGTFLKKVTSTASSVSDPTIPAYGGGAVGFPVCVLHFVGHNGTDNWAYADCENITCIADTTSPNTTSTVYGLFFRGVIGGKIKNCFTNFIQVGFFFGSGSTITSEISLNQASNCQRGFYQHFMTSTSFFSNYANKFRFAGYYWSAYYSDVFANAADNVGSPWKVGTAEISLAYQGNGWKGGTFFGNGIETHNGSCYSFSNCISTRFFSNLALDITSNYTGGSDVCLWENNSNNSCVYEDNRMQTTSMTGTGARHFIYKITTELGNYQWQRNRFVAVISDNTDTSTWTNISGAITETFALIHSIGTFTPTVLGTTLAGVTTYGTRNGSYERIGNVVYFRLRVTWTNMTGTGNIVVGGLPFTAENTESMPVSILADSLTFANQLTCAVRQNSTNIDPFTMSTGGAAANVPVDVAATIWITGTYNTV